MLTVKRYPTLDTATSTKDTNVSDVNGNNVVVSNNTVASYGLTIKNARVDLAVASDDAAEILVASGGPVELGKVRVRATNDDLRVKELYITVTGSGATGATAPVDQLARLVQSPTLVDAAGKVVAYGSTITTSGVAFIKFNNFVDSSYIVARNTDSVLTVKSAISGLNTGDSGVTVRLSIGVDSSVTDPDAQGGNVVGFGTGSINAIRVEGSVATLADADVVASTGTTKADLVTAGKLIVAVAGVSDAGAGKIKFTVTNNGSDTVKLQKITVGGNTSSGVTLYKGDVTSESERISAMNATGAIIDVTDTIGNAIAQTLVEIAAGQSVTLLADFNGDAAGDNNTINVSVNDIAYFDKVQGAYETAAINTIAAYKGTGLPASTSFSRSKGTY